MEDKLKALATLIETETRTRLMKDYPNMASVILDTDCRVKITPAKKYTKVDVGRSGKYMVVNDTGEIFGIKGYGVIHRGHQYGTLDTINEWYWGQYTAIKKRSAA